MKVIILGVVTLLASSVLLAQTAGEPSVRRIDADPANGFSYAYYLYVPDEIRVTTGSKAIRSLLVIPNNTGSINDDINVHDADVKRKIVQIGPMLASKSVAVPVLVPVFPRPATEHRIYTHSLDRDTMTTDRKEFARFDLQLLAMMADARKRLENEGIITEKRVLMQGYSASGMFVNRFVFLHPDAVKAAIVGAPGGWPIAPVADYRKKKLTFPAGIADLKEVSGKQFDLKAVKKVPLFMILGGEDSNDAVPMGDAYDPRESRLVIDLFGRTPVERFPSAEKLYRQAGLNAKFKLYPGTGHKMSAEMTNDQIAFIKKYALP